jgi:hypothetical protein
MIKSKLISKLVSKEVSNITLISKPTLYAGDITKCSSRQNDHCFLYREGNFRILRLPNYVVCQTKIRRFGKNEYAYFPFTRHEPHTKRCFRMFFHATGTSLSSSNVRGIHIQTHKHSRSTIRLPLHRFTEPLPSNERRIPFIEPLPSNDWRDIHRDTQTDGKDLGSRPFIGN